MTELWGIDMTRTATSSITTFLNLGVIFKLLKWCYTAYRTFNKLRGNVICFLFNLFCQHLLYFKALRNCGLGYETMVKFMKKNKRGRPRLKHYNQIYRVQHVVKRSNSLD